MKEIIIQNSDAGTKLDKFLIKYLSLAPASFIYKIIRKKYIKINGIKANGKEILNIDDIIQIYLSDDTINKFIKSSLETEKRKISIDNEYFEPNIIFEDDNILIVNKPAGILSQKAKSDDISINDICLEYLRRNKNLNYNGFTPSVCNRLDRNTEGIIIFAKTYICAKELSQLLKNRNLHKYYYCICKGNIDKTKEIDGYLVKDNDKNIVQIKNHSNDKQDLIKTKIIPIYNNELMSLLEIELITGKSHQIRAHLASIGHPLLGDYKYGDRRFNDIYKRQYGITHQLLFSHKLIFPQMEGELSNLSFKEFNLEIPQIYKDIYNGNME